MVTTYGDSANYQWCIAISTAQSSGPSGDVLYLLCESISGSFATKSKISNYSGGSSFSNRNGKRSYEVIMKNCVVVAYSSNTLTESFGKELFFLATLTKASAAPSYLHIKNWGETSAELVDIGFNAAVSSQTAYMVGYPTANNWKLEKNRYYFDTIRFSECLN